MYLEKINEPKDINKLSNDELKVLASEIRDALMNRLSKHGGHFGPNFGMVETIIALHYVFNSPVDKIVYDVSHQSYPHKMLTGRKDAYLYEEHFEDVSGYTNPEESEHDFFNVGHTSTSISLASGLVKARDLKGDKENIIAVIGDGSLSGGEALEGLDFASELQSNFIIIVNDNDMSIAENHGGLYKNLKELRESKGTCACNLFKAMNLDYIYVEDGNNLETLIHTFYDIKDINHPIVVHINTQKGKGYQIAEENKENWHWCMPFDIETGKPKVTFEGENYGDLTADYLLYKMKKDSKVVALVAGVPTNIGFTKDKRERAGKQFVDVGIAEEHAVTFAAGLAAGGLQPVVAIYSSFLQRAYDQILHDVCIQNLPVVFAIDRAGLVGSDGETHQGIFDLSYLSSIPNMHIMAPKNKWELSDMLKFAIDFQGPIALRYPRGEAFDGLREHREPIILGMGEWIYHEKDIVLVAVGSMVKTALAVREALQLKGYACSIINARFVKPIDTEILNEAVKDHSLIVTMEENVASGGFGEKVREYLDESGYQGSLLTISIPDEYVEHGNVDILREEVGIDAYSIQRRIEEVLCGQ